MADNVFLASGHSMNMGPKGGISTVTVGDWVAKGSPNTAIQCTVLGTGAVGATIDIEVSNGGPDANNPMVGIQPVGTVAGTITLAGTTVASDGFTTQNSPWKYVRMKVTAISGTGAVVTGIMGI